MHRTQRRRQQTVVVVAFVVVVVGRWLSSSSPRRGSLVCHSATVTTAELPAAVTRPARPGPALRCTFLRGATDAGGRNQLRPTEKCIIQTVYVQQLAVMSFHNKGGRANTCTRPTTRTDRPWCSLSLCNWRRYIGYSFSRCATPGLARAPCTLLSRSFCFQCVHSASDVSAFSVSISNSRRRDVRAPHAAAAGRVLPPPRERVCERREATAGMRVSATIDSRFCDYRPTTVAGSDRENGKARRGKWNASQLDPQATGVPVMTTVINIIIIIIIGSRSSRDDDSKNINQ